MAKLENKFDNHERHIFQCDCWDHHYIVIDTDKEDDDWNLFSIDGAYVPTRAGWFQRRCGRFAMIWKIIRGKELTLDSIILNDATRERIIKVLQEAAPLNTSKLQTEESNDTAESNSGS